MLGGKTIGLKRHNTEPQEAVELTEEECFTAIEEGIATDHEQELELRLLAWRQGNDRYREADPDGIAVEMKRHPNSQSNLERLLELIDVASKDTPKEYVRLNTKTGERTTVRDDGVDQLILTKAEVLRQLGRFDEAIDQLKSVQSPNLRTVAAQIERLCCDRDRIVRRLVDETPKHERQIAPNQTELDPPLLPGESFPPTMD